jgi:3-methyladenine DNA glycosylase/8-oxoguanine DNA glycosylase
VVEIRLMDGRTGVRVDVDGDLSANEQHETEAAVTWMLALDQDFTAFYAAAQSEPKLAQVVEKAQGRVLRSPTLFEDVVKTILTTNTIWGSTKRMVKNVVQQFGEPLPGQPERRAFPTPERLAETDAETLRNATRLGYRAPYILDLARRVASGALDLEALKAADLPTLELRKRLLALKGVGNYAAANLLMILGRSDFIPIDSWALTMVSREWYGGQPVTPAQVEAAFARWGQWKGLAYWFWDWKQA